MVRVLGNTLLAVTAIAFTAVTVGNAIRTHTVALDYQRAFRPASHALVHHQSPYPASGGLRAGLYHADAYLYPPLVGYLEAPLLVLPPLVAAQAVLWSCLLCLPASLLLLGVRDWRCHAVAFCSPPLVSAVQTGAITLPLLLLVATAWRFRGRIARAGTVGVAVAAKLFLWPMLFWPTHRRTRSIVAAATATCAAIVLPWTASSFAGFAAYPRLLQHASAIEGPRSISPASMFHRAGVSWFSAEVIAIVAGLALVACASRTSDERRSFAVLIIAALVASPIVWPHYLTLIFAAIAVLQPRFGMAWLLTVGFCVAPAASMDHPLTWWALCVVPIGVLAVAIASSWRHSALREAGTVVEPSR